MQKDKIVRDEKPSGCMRGIREKRRIVYNVEVSQISTVKLALQKFIAFRLSGNKLEVIFEIHDNCSTEAFLKALPSAQMITLSQFRVFRLRQDIFEDKVYFTDWPYSLSASGHGVTFSRKKLGSKNANQKVDQEKLNLWAKIFGRDFSPICEKCACSTCKNHSRSYIHHLLRVHEISASILLAEHNTYQFKKWLKEFPVSVRQS